MLKKLLKYDFKAVGRLWWIMAVVVLCMSLAGSFVLRFVIENIDNENMSFLCLIGILFLIACFFCIIGSVIVTYILVFWRFYHHLFSDEGYLTFTLPVTRRDILLSKTLNSTIWISLHFVLLAVCAGFFALISPPVAEGDVIFNFVVFETLGDLFSIIAPEMGGWLALFIFEVILILVVTAFFTTCLIQFCITVGAMIAKKLKLLAAIGVYYLVNTILSVITQFCGTLGTIFIGAGLGSMLVNATLHQGCGIVALAMLIFTVMIATFTATIHFITQGMLERKLNLA